MAEQQQQKQPPVKTYIVEHLDPELEEWSEHEYAAIALEAAALGSAFCLSSVSPRLRLPPRLAGMVSRGELRTETRGVEDMYPENGPEGGVPGAEGKKSRVCLLDPKAAKDLSSEDGENFDVFLFGGILGDDPPQDRTAELRKKGFEGRRLGPVQMTTDTAVRVTRMVVQETNKNGEKYTLDNIPYVDNPELKFNKYESVKMPFRYVLGEDGNPVMPENMLEVIKKSGDQSF